MIPKAKTFSSKTLDHGKTKYYLEIIRTDGTYNLNLNFVLLYDFYQGSTEHMVTLQLITLRHLMMKAGKMEWNNLQRREQCEHDIPGLAPLLCITSNR